MSPDIQTPFRWRRRWWWDYYYFYY